MTSISQVRRRLLTLFYYQSDAKKCIAGALLFFGCLVLALACTKGTDNSTERPLKTLLTTTKVEFRHAVPLKFDTYHVQGLEVTEQSFFVTSVDKESKRGWLFKINRKAANPVVKKDLTDSTLIHPGGLQFDGRFLWLPNAEYDRDGPSKILALDTCSLVIERSFQVDDHIGAVASDGKDRLFGVNWDALQFHVWDFEGNPLQTIDSPTSMAYQDIKFVAGRLLCNGHQAHLSVVDIIDPFKWELVKRINLPNIQGIKRLSQEGMAFDGQFYFLPEDGPCSRILSFMLH